MSNVRTRFAPSPTGFLHVGGVRTALFAWLLARQNQGEFILRIEDTDRARHVQGAEKHIQDSLKWVGIDWDEGADIGGPQAPYRQSERLEIYKDWANKLIDKGLAYADPYTTEELQAFRDKAKTEKKAFLFRDYRPKNPPTWDGSRPLRLKSNPKSYTWHDAVMGKLTTGPEVIDDFILIKSDGYPTYNFCHIVDDALMKVTHVIRSQEFISSVPKYLNLYEALKIKPPIMATLPFVMAPDGKKKLSKRDGAKDILDYAHQGYLPEAMMNFLATLGWNDGTEQEIFSKSELIKKFSLDRVHRSGARFDETRLEWLNGQWLRRLEVEDLMERARPFWPKSAIDTQEAFKKDVLKLVQDRLKTLADLPLLTSYFFEEPKINWSLVDSNKQLKKLKRSEQLELLKAAYQELKKVDSFKVDNLQTTLNQLLESTKQKPVILFGLIRLALTWAPFSPGLPETMATLGREVVLHRLEKVLT